MPVHKEKEIHRFEDFRAEEYPWEIEKEYARQVLDMLPFLHSMIENKEKELIIN